MRPTADKYIELPDGRYTLPDSLRVQELPSALNNNMENQRINQINPIENVDDSITEQYDRSTVGLMSARDILSMPLEPLIPLWGPFIYKGSVVLLNGRTGVGKSTLLYGLFTSAALGHSFAGISFERPLRVIYSDLETPSYLRQIKLQRICNGEGPDNLLFVPHDLANFQNNLPTYEQIVSNEDADILVLDTISEAFNTNDENSNAEAVRQFWTIRDFSLNTGCAVIAVHHTGKGASNELDVFAGRGATARADKVDIVLNLLPVKDDSDVLCLAIGKDKIAGNESKLYLKKAGNDTFEVVEHHEDWDATQLEKCKRFVLFFSEDREFTTSEVQAEGQKQGYSQPTITRSLGALVDADKIKKVRHGFYQGIKSSSQNIGFNDLILDSTASAHTTETN